MTRIGKGDTSRVKGRTPGRHSPRWNCADVHSAGLALSTGCWSGLRLLLSGTRPRHRRKGRRNRIKMMLCRHCGHPIGEFNLGEESPPLYCGRWCKAAAKKKRRARARGKTRKGRNADSRTQGRPGGNEGMRSGMASNAPEVVEPAQVETRSLLERMQ